MAELIISVSGLRGAVGESLTPDVAIRYACAFATVAPPGPLVLTRDGRATGPMLVAALQAGLTAVGRSIIDGGVAATPTTGVLVREHRAAGGIQVSASHNPPQDNGLKLFSSEGRVLPASVGHDVLKQYHDEQPRWVTYERLGRVEACRDTTSAHWRLIEPIIDLERVRRRRFKVLLDANHGAGSLLGRRLLETLNCDLVLAGGEPDGQFEHPPEPTAENLAGVLSQVRESGADVGFCQDPDADRLAVIDEQGRYLGEEYTLALCVEHVLASRPGPVVTNCSTSRMSEDIARRFDVPFFRSAVGEANVVDLMLAEKAVIGGEGNGGSIDPRVGLVRDSFVGMALLLDAMAARQEPISNMADALPRYEIEKTKVSLRRDKISVAMRALEKHFVDANVDRLDGLRFDWPDHWLLVRASNTEPIVRTVAEAKSADVVRLVCEEANRVMLESAD